AGGGGGANLPAGRHLARAFPDRVAQPAGARGRFRLANGRQAGLDETDALASAPFLVVTDMTGAAATSRIRAAAALTREDLEELFARHIEEAPTLSFDVASGSVRARRQRRLGALRLADEPVAVTDFTEAALILAQAAVSRPNALPWSKDQ